MVFRSVAELATVFFYVAKKEVFLSKAKLSFLIKKVFSGELQAKKPRLSRVFRFEKGGLQLC